MSQEKLGKLVGVSQNAISKIESNSTKRSFAHTIIAIGVVLNANVRWIQTGKGEPYAINDVQEGEAAELLAKCDGRKLAVATAMLRALVESDDGE